MRDMRNIFIASLLLLSSLFSTATTLECTEKFSNILQHKSSLNRIANPKYIQVIKTIQDTTKSIPITVSAKTVFSTNPNFDAFLHIKDSEDLKTLYLGDPLFKELHTGKSINYFIAYPVKNSDQTYISGFLVLGYEHKIEYDYQLYIGIELVNTYLSQLFEICGD